VAVVFLMLMLSALVWLNGASIDNALGRDQIEKADTNPLVGLQNNENWLILKVSFPDKPFPDSESDDLLGVEGSIANYVDEMSGGSSKVTITVIVEAWNSPQSESYWGTDSENERDSGDESGGASELARAAIESLLGEGGNSTITEELSNWDLDGDKTIDRILILHSGEAQESGGQSSAIWSHFSRFQDSLLIGDYYFEHYTMASVYSGQGVIIHEMLHQMGAVDLYDVHSDTPSGNWHGLGDWDVMASGNWIGGGEEPSLPSASTMNLIGASNPTIVDARVNGLYEVTSISLGGEPLSINIAPDEYIWVSFRSEQGFDRGLPGFGVLVEQQDLNYGDLDSNTVNSDPENAWSKIVEADGDDALLRARDYGSSGDVFSDGDEFGGMGIEIRDNRGRLVPWVARVSNVTNDSATISFQPSFDEKVSILTPRSPVELLPGEPINFDFAFAEKCVLESSLSPSNQDFSEVEYEVGEYQIQIFDSANSSTDIGIIEGKIGCSGQSLIDIRLKWVIVGNRVSNSTLEASIHWDDSSVVNLYPDYEGNASREYRVTLEGPVSRIASTASQVTLSPNIPIVLQVNPTGLLEPGMLARGELILTDSNNLEQRIPIILNAESGNPLDPYLSWLALPSNAISLIFVILALSIATGRRAE